MPRIEPGPPCGVCGKPSVARNLCPTHYSRWQHHGHVEQTRPDDWGKRNTHPMWDRWKGLARCPQGRVPSWDDMWVFVADVGDRPSAKHTLKRLDETKPWGPTNAYWREPVGVENTRSSREQSALYQREWRARNQIKTKESYLRKSFGIGLAEYNNILEMQGGGCAICGGKDQHYRLAVDHCHDTKAVRGLLCANCNRGLGLFKDSPDRLERAMNYLKSARLMPSA